ncbi:MAG: thioredoxin domain-containing protein [Kofleriaceae bacterium]|nr:thioredoxin domain-containing protein [Kofleriaceae bacterium]MBP6835736.1 thioredoxin domain-containing protein [Kofleriaceae bacterium]
MANRLAASRSPYLRQHQDNPVDWWPWGGAAFAEARRLDRPVFVSIGYAACHWCHVMAHESFEDPRTAALMNARYVSIKVDREELPEVDAIYLAAIQVQGEGGGWPLSAWCRPDGKPFFLGTYFPPVSGRGRAGFADMLTMLADAYADERAKVDENVDALMEGLVQVDRFYRVGRPGAVAAEAVVTAQTVIAAGRTVAQRCDGRGGLAGAPKFPNSSVHEVLGRAARLPFGAPARAAYLGWAKAMITGGIYDHVGGGWARYAVDDRWLVPHFEKMLYDNGQLLAISADALALVAADPAEASTAAALREVLVDSVAFLDRELTDPAGGLFASLDADSEGEEGRYYVWTPAQVRAALGVVDALQLCRAYGVTDDGNFEHATTVLSRVTPRGAGSDERALAELRQRLLAARAARVRPGTDDKVLTGWNALAITGLLRAWAVTAHAPARALAERVGHFLATRMLSGDGGDPAGGAAVTLARVYSQGQVEHEGTLDDYAFTARAFLDLAEATGEAAWWRRGVALLEVVRARFVAEVGGELVVYLTGADDSGVLVHRPESHHDGAMPSGAGVAVEQLVRVGLIADDRAALVLAERILRERLPGAQPVAQARLYCALDTLLHHDVLVVTAGAGADDLRAAARACFAPSLMLAGPWAAPSWHAGKAAGPGGVARAYLCRGTTCSPPIDTPAALVAALVATER